MYLTYTGAIVKYTAYAMTTAVPWTHPQRHYVHLEVYIRCDFPSACLVMRVNLIPSYVFTHSSVTTHHTQLNLITRSRNLVNSDAIPETRTVKQHASCIFTVYYYRLRSWRGRLHPTFHKFLSKLILLHLLL